MANNLLKQTTFIFLIVNIFLITYCSSSVATNNVKKEKVVIKNVVYETEEGYVVTNKGVYALPNPSTEVVIENAAFTILVDSLKRVTGKEAVLYIHNDTVVGISSESEGINFVPEYKKRKKIVYSSPPLKISTTLKRWDADSYRLSIITNDGTFCIFNTFEVSDYYKKVFGKLKKYYGMGIILDAKITILYHKIENSYECQGEIEDIEF